MNSKYSNYPYWSNTTPSARRDPLPDGTHTVYSNDECRKAIIHVEDGDVQLLELWKLTRYGTWGKSEEDQIRLT
jgi:hypothetical protein